MLVGKESSKKWLGEGGGERIVCVICHIGSYVSIKCTLCLCTLLLTTQVMGIEDPGKSPDSVD
jgi:hypothetical protein